MDLIIDPEFSALIPPLKPEERQGLEASLKAEGCRDALVVWVGHNILLDGQNRYEICQRLGIPFNVIELEQASRDQAAIWIIRNQFDRRNLSTYDRGILALRLKPLLEAQAKANSLANLKQNRSTECNNCDSRSDAVGRVNAEVAKDAGISHQTLRKIEYLNQHAEPEVIEAIRQHKTSIDKEYRQITEPERRVERMAALIEPARIEGRFPVIYADPPWQYEFPISETREIENHYPTMELADICALPVDQWALDDCVLFLWTTPPKLGEAFEVLRAWSFVYRTNMVWDKEVIGPGYWCRQQHELSLIATKGKPRTPAPSDQVPSVIHSRRTSIHSQKPEIVYEIIETMSPQFYEAGLLLELFQRKPRKGWKGWGNQTTETYQAVE